ncbi:hypothetical protein BDN72DRAFT_816254 [Pluteus cervinus]|uniref:Uncharacterized protein n=1 Tax=Pluteus cervinus TaxID=181527 RepID=A0ACD3B3Q0_9AGAR|nr:hypothetical protein BDN72DRAFT_816254 [Pluteus cervinus]
MDESLEFLNHNHPSPPRVQQTKPAGSGLTLILPPLRGGKPLKLSKKGKQRIGVHDVDSPLSKPAPRPVKLKPLKEVLARLIAQLKKKDAYGFFLQPVDLSLVPTYMDVVKRPMDFGTMTTKVDRGKYRSLEEFASDFKLVTENAKLFNPPGTIYYTEAERIEAWGLDHISKSASTVIQYETDWNIEIEKDDEAQPGSIDDEDPSLATPMDVDDPGPSARSSSVTSQVPAGRRATRGPYKKAAPTTAPPAKTISESIDAEGRLPGSKDGLGAFPTGSDWARTMLALKLKGKRYKTKKERLRIEKEGPPTLADGTLDYAEMEDPFSMLSSMVPDPLSRPTVTPVYPPMKYAPTPSIPEYDPTRSQSQPPAVPPPFPAAVNIYDPGQSQLSVISATSTNGVAPRKQRHWAVIRNAPSRAKGKEKEEDVEVEQPAWQSSREVHAADFGSFARLAGELAAEMHRQGVVGKEGEEETRLFSAIRESIEAPQIPQPLEFDPDQPEVVTPSNYWSSQRAAEAEDYLRDIVYGGVDGYAYARSLAEFANYADATPGTFNPDLGMPLADWVERHVVDDLTEGRHALIRHAALQLATFKSKDRLREDVKPVDEVHPSVPTQVATSLNVYPLAMTALSVLLQIRGHKIDMGALIKTPDELFLSEEEWAGKVFRERRKAQAQAKVNGTPGDGTTSGSEHNPNSEFQLEATEELDQVLQYVAKGLMEVNQKLQSEQANPMGKRTLNGTGNKQTDLTGGVGHHVGENGGGGGPAVVDSSTSGVGVGGPNSSYFSAEDPVIRNLRLNLLALAKRAPLDSIARLPKDLVPEHIRHFVPTLGTASG